jgi:hypothetical protein
MKKWIFMLPLCCLFLFCDKKEENPVIQKKVCTSVKASGKGKKFEMYKMSEMSMLMEQMYADNERLKERIKNGDTIGKFPNHFMKIHKAAMTDDKENDTFFKKQAEIFINAQKLIYEDTKNAREHFNEGVSACLECHKVKCGGPIPRIKKLYID